MRKNSRLLVVRLSAMGDVAMSVHAVRQLRRTYPDLGITVLTKERFFPFFRDVERVDFIGFDCKEHGGFAGLWRLARRIARHDIDAVADLHDILRSKILRMLIRLRTGCPVAVIDKENRFKRLATRRRDKNLKQLKHSVERYCEVFARAGYPIPLPAAGRIARPVPAALGTKGGGQRWIGLAPFSKQPSKSLPECTGRRLAEMLAAEYDRVFLFTGDGSEFEFARAIESRLGNVTAVFGRIPLDEEIDLMANLDAIVTMDSAAMHMASLVGTPTVSVWGSTHPATGFYGWGCGTENCIQLDLPCRPCSVYGNKPCLTGDYRCMTGIAPETIFERVAKIAVTPTH